MAYSPLHLTTMGSEGMMVNSAPARDKCPRWWSYMSDDAMATVRVIGYFSDAYHRGMRKGDKVYVVVTSAGAVSATYDCAVLTCTAAAGADLTDGVSLTLTNSD